MPRLIAFVLCLCAGLAAASARAQDGATCGFLRDVERLRPDLDQLRSGRMAVAEFETRLAGIRNALAGDARMAVFSDTERQALHAYVQALRQDWALSGIRSDGRQIPGLTQPTEQVLSALVDIHAKFGCVLAPTASTALLLGFHAQTVSAAVLGLTTFGICMALYALYRLLWRRKGKRLICHVPALLHYGAHCTSTTILDISCGGAKIQSPPLDVGATNLVLHLPGYSLPVRVAWSNGLFAGLRFDMRLSVGEVEDIAAIDARADHPEGLTLRAPSCFRPGCHQTCRNHRPTLAATAATDIPGRGPPS